MQVFNHHIYEFKKGVRNMDLCTLSGNLEEKVKTRLQKDGICYMIQKLKNGNINVFFGTKECLLVADKLCKNKPLNLLSPEEDFMLGILLGYSVCEQCKRYCKKQNQAEINAIFNL